MLLSRHVFRKTACALLCVCVVGAVYARNPMDRGVPGYSKVSALKQAEDEAAKKKQVVAGNSQAQPTKAAPVEQKHELHFVADVEGSYANVSGPGKAASTYDQGFTYWTALGLSGKGNFGQVQYTHSFRVRFSDDTKRNNGTKFGLDKAAFGVIYKDAKLNGGDFYESYSQYTNRAQLQGVNFAYAPAKKGALQVRSLFGYAYARWDEMWRSEDLKVKNRQVAGVNLRQAFMDRFNVGLSYMRTDDSDRMIWNDPLNYNNIGSIDYSITAIPKKVTISGESAASFTTINPNSLATQNQEIDGMANRVQVAGTFDPHNLTVQYERVDPRFRTLTGAADLDREKVNFTWRFKTSPVTNLTANFLWYQDQLENPSNRTQLYRPQLSLNTSKLFKRETNRMNMNVAVECQEHASGRSLANIYSGISYGDTFFKLLNSATDLGVNRIDNCAKGRDKFDYTFKQTFGTSHSISQNLVLKPTLNFGSTYTEDKITNDINKVFDYSLGLIFDMPKSKLSTNFKVGQNRYISQRVDDSEQFYFNFNVNYRPESIFGWKTGATLYLRALMNDFNFDNADRSFRESNVTVGVSIPLDAFYGKK